MTTKLPVRLIKKKKPKDAEIPAEVESAVGPNKWSTVVRAWVVEFQERDRNELLPAFESLFKDALPRSGDAD